MPAFSLRFRDNLRIQTACGRRIFAWSGVTMKANSLTFRFQDGSCRYESESVGANRSWATASKVPEVAIAFWIIKIAATTLGETGGDALSMSMNLGYLLSTMTFMACFIVAPAGQGRAQGLPNG